MRVPGALGRDRLFPQSNGGPVEKWLSGRRPRSRLFPQWKQILGAFSGRFRSSTRATFFREISAENCEKKSVFVAFFGPHTGTIGSGQNPAPLNGSRWYHRLPFKKRVFFRVFLKNFSTFFEKFFRNFFEIFSKNFSKKGASFVVFTSDSISGESDKKQTFGNSLGINFGVCFNLFLLLENLRFFSCFSFSPSHGKYFEDLPRRIG